MTKLRIFSLFSALFIIVFAFAFMVGTSLLNLIPFLSGIGGFSGEGYTVYYGIEFFKYAIHHLGQTFFFGDLWCGLPNGLLLIYFGFLALVVIVLAFIKKRNEQMFYTVPIIILGFGLTSLNALLFGYSLYDGDIHYNYFQLFILNSHSSVSIFARVCFIVMFVLYVLLILNIIVFFILVFISPRRSEKYLKKQYEKQFSTIKEVRKVSNEEIVKYIKEHRDEVREILGINSSAIDDKSIEEATNEALEKELQKAIEKDPSASIVVEANGIKKEYDPSTKKILTSKVQETTIDVPTEEETPEEPIEEEDNSSKKEDTK